MNLLDAARAAYEANQAEQTDYLHETFEEDRKKLKRILGEVFGNEWGDSFAFTPSPIGKALASIEGYENVTFVGHDTTHIRAYLTAYRQCSLCGGADKSKAILSLSDLWETLDGDHWTDWHGCPQSEPPLQYEAFTELSCGDMGCSIGDALERVNSWLDNNPNVVVEREHISQTDTRYTITVAYREV